MKKIWMIILIIVFLCFVVGCTISTENITISSAEPILSTSPSETLSVTANTTNASPTSPTNSISIPNGGGENMTNREKLEVIEKKTGIDFQDSEVLTIELDESMKLEDASLKIKKESIDLIISQLSQEEWKRELDNRYIPKIWSGYIENRDDYMFFNKVAPSKNNKSTNRIDALIVPDKEYSVYIIYIFYIGE